MSDKDIAINITSGPLATGVLGKKPAYLVTLQSETKNKYVKFITIDKPDLLNGFIYVKGFYCDLDEDEIVKKYTEMLTAISKDLILEMMLPWHKICSIRSLVFKAK